MAIASEPAATDTPMVDFHDHNALRRRVSSAKGALGRTNA
jgi:hypothetical protein